MAIGYFGSQGYTVSIPLNDTQDYDLIVEINGELKKVQVKATNQKVGEAYKVPLRSISGTTKKVYKTVKETDIDLLFCLCGDGTMYLIPKNLIVNTNTIALVKEKSKFSNINCFDSSKFIVNF